MSDHKPTVVQDKAEKFFARCNCGESSGPNHYLVRQHAEDWIIAHEQQVARARANLRRGSGSLRTERDHAQRMLDDPNVTAADKRIWQIILDGANSRLGHETKEEELW